MNTQQLKSTGLSLLISSVLMILTMVLHPVGGDFGHLTSIVGIGIISHSIGILSIPFAAFGYWGVMHALDREFFLSRVAFSCILFGLVAVMIAATMNGLVLMQFVQRYADASEEVIAGLKPIFRYNHYLNLANDYIYMGGIALSTLLWSVAILRTRELPVWLGYLGLVAVGVGLISLLSGFVLTDVAGFRLLVFGTAAWTLAAGWSLWRRRGS